MNKQDEKYLLDRIWYKKKSVKNTFPDISRYPHIFLVNAPLTFGHSELVVPKTKETDSFCESSLFQSATPLIVNTLKVFEIYFKKRKYHERAQFQKLAEDTYTYGKYLKTLILRTSANDDPNNKIKFHLVPYFESHQVDCKKRFNSLHKSSPDKKGGMIGWLGERETELDKLLVEGLPGPITLEEIGRCVWKLPEQTKQLRQLWIRLFNK